MNTGADAADQIVRMTLNGVEVAAKITGTGAKELAVLLYRTVSISPQAIEVLKQQKAKTNDQYVFPSPNGGPISPDSVNNMLKRVLERAGIPKVRFHDLRHTFATIALQNGVDIKTVSGMLGHFSAGFTLDTYAHVTTSAQKEAAQTMASVLSM